MAKGEKIKPEEIGGAEPSRPAKRSEEEMKYHIVELQVKDFKM